MKLKNTVFMLVTIILIVAFFILSQDKKLKIKNEKPMVVLSTFSLYDIATHISQNTLSLSMILPFGVDAHSFEPTPKLMTKILGSQLVIYSGAGLEPWTHSFEFKSKVIDMSKYVKLLKLSLDTHHKEDEHNHGSLDPHYWLDIDNMITATKVIGKAFIKLSPKNTKLYKRNRDKYITMLKSLDNKYKNSLSMCKKDMIIVNHNAFSYLSNKYGFGVEALSGLSPEAQPSAKSMVKLVQHIKEHNVSTVFFESFVSDRAMKSIATEAKVSVDVLQPLGNITKYEANKNFTYEDIMLINLQKISKALDCR